MTLRRGSFQPSVRPAAVARLGHGVITLHRKPDDAVGQDAGSLIPWFGFGLEFIPTPGVPAERAAEQSITRSPVRSSCGSAGARLACRNRSALQCGWGRDRRVIWVLGVLWT